MEGLHQYECYNLKQKPLIDFIAPTQDGVETAKPQTREYGTQWQLECKRYKPRLLSPNHPSCMETNDEDMFDHELDNDEASDNEWSCHFSD